MRVLIVIAFAAALGCSAGQQDDCYVAPPGAPPLVIESARAAVTNCTKNGGGISSFSIDLAVPGVHSFASVGDPSWGSFDCTNAVAVDPLVVSEDGIALEWATAIETEYVAPPPPTAGNPNPEPDYLLIDPRFASLGQSTRVFAHHPVTVDLSGAALLSGDVGAWHTRNALVVTVSSSPLRRAPDGSLEDGQTFVQLAVDPRLGPGLEHNRAVEIPATSVALAAGRFYSIGVTSIVDATDFGGVDQFNTDTDIVVSGHVDVGFTPGDPASCDAAPPQRRNRQ